MQKGRITIVIAAGIFCVCCASTSYCREDTTKRMDFEGFSKLEIGGPFDVEVTQSEKFEVTFIGDEKFFSDTKVTRFGDTLKISLNNHFRCRNCKLSFKISMPTLDAVDLGGAVSASITGFKGSGHFEVDLTGASSLNGDIEASSVDMDLSGASDVDLLGSATKLTIDASGASDVQLERFTVEIADVELSGASDADISVTNELSADLSGASDLDYSGNPSLTDIDTSGASSMSHRQS